MLSKASRSSPQYLGHHTAHQLYQKLARQSALETAEADLISYHGIPPNPSEKASLVNVVLLPAWQLGYMFIMDDHMLGKIDAVVQRWILKDAKGMEKKYNILKLVTRVHSGGMGLRQICWLRCFAYVITVQCMLREEMGIHNTCITDVYVETAHQTGNLTPLQRVLRQTQDNMKTLFDEESSDDEDLFRRHSLDPQM